MGKAEEISGGDNVASSINMYRSDRGGDVTSDLSSSAGYISYAVCLSYTDRNASCDALHMARERERDRRAQHIFNICYIRSINGHN